MFRLYMLSAMLLMMIGSWDRATAQPQAPRPVQGPAATINDRLSTLELRLERVEREMKNRSADPMPVTTVSQPQPSPVVASGPIYASGVGGPQSVLYGEPGACGTAQTGFMSGMNSGMMTVSTRSGWRPLARFRVRPGRGSGGCQ